MPDNLFGVCWKRLSYIEVIYFGNES